jgi:hypothetical protein
MRTQDWLLRHGATIEQTRNGLQVITVTAEKPSEGQYKHEWILHFDDVNGDPEQSWLSILLKPNPFDTLLEVEYEGSYSCSCKGKGCIKCNDELNLIAQGLNPWQHHTTK